MMGSSQSLQDAQRRMREFKVVVVGNGGVGKSALTVQFVQGLFVANYDATIEDSYRKHIQLDGEEARIEILDTAGTEQFSGMRDLYVKNGQGFVLVYAVDDLHSFREILAIRELIVRIKQTDNVPMVIVGNKSDLTAQRVVSVEHGRQMARQCCSAFFETSAKLNHNVSEVFKDVCRQIQRYRLEQAPQPKKRTLRLSHNKDKETNNKQKSIRNRRERGDEKAKENRGGSCCSLM